MEITNFKKFIQEEFQNCPDVIDEKPLFSTSGTLFNMFLFKSSSILDHHSG